MSTQKPAQAPPYSLTSIWFDPERINYPLLAAVNAVSTWRAVDIHVAKHQTHGPGRTESLLCIAAAATDAGMVKPVELSVLRQFSTLIMQWLLYSNVCRSKKRQSKMILSFHCSNWLMSSEQPIWGVFSREKIWKKILIQQRQVKPKPTPWPD